MGPCRSVRVDHSSTSQSGYTHQLFLTKGRPAAPLDGWAGVITATILIAAPHAGGSRLERFEGAPARR